MSRAVDHKLVADVQKYAGGRCHKFAEHLTIYLGALVCYTKKGEAKWLERFDEKEALLRAFVHEQRMAEASRLIDELGLKRPPRTS